MSDSNFQDRRHEPRYEVSNLHRIPVKIKRKTGDPKDTIDGELLALSRSGAKVSTAACLPFAEEITLQITFGNRVPALDLAAKVCWSRPSDGLQWLIGCSFSPALSDESIAQLAASGIIERRQHAREPVCIAATAKWQLEEESFPVEIRDYSTGGFCLVGPRSAQVGHGVQISITTSDDETYQISGRVCWHLEQDESHLVGCIFTASQDVAQLLEAVERVQIAEQSMQHATSTPSGRHRAWPQVAATTILMIGAALLAACIPYWITNRPWDKRIASLRNWVARPLVRTTSHDGFQNEAGADLADRSFPAPLGHDRTASDEQPQPQESSDEIPPKSSAPTPSDGGDPFVRGTEFYRRGEYPQAIAEFRMAAEKDPQNALYFYLLAMSQFQANDLERAEENVQVAIHLEGNKPIENRHSLLSLYHDNARLWVERRRSVADTPRP
jgi:tetratricopeptide (TPR) repeat protein